MVWGGCGAIIIVHQGNLIVKKIEYYKNGDIDKFYIPDDMKQTLLQDCVDNIKKKTRKK